MPRQVAEGVNGSVTVGEIDGAVEIHGVNGQVEVAQAKGAAEFHDINGNISVTLKEVQPGGLKLNSI
jgi:DUF4097 and DUF4098 domain-containing protein YvlB